MTSSKRKLTILVSGMIAGDPWQGGATWAVLQYLLGLRQLGHTVYFVEPVAERALRPAGAALSGSENAIYFENITTTFGLDQNAALLLAGTKQTFGLSYQDLRGIARSADLLLNISGMLTDAELAAPVPVRAYLDLDPAFNQLWHAVEGLDMRFDGHTHFVTVGQCVGEADCPVPTCGRDWIKTWQPVVLDHWPVAHQITHHAFTTVANWRGYGSITHEGKHYGQKAHSLRQFIQLPGLTRERFLLALAIHPGETTDLAALAAHGWSRLDAATVAPWPAAYQQFIQGSRAELGIAKSGYVVSRCGWFSDRSACYLASGRPVVAQDTGFSRHVPTGEGLFAFQDSDTALAAIEALGADYSKHARHARALAEEYFDSRKVLGQLLARLSL